MGVRVEIWRAPGAGTFAPLVQNIDIQSFSCTDLLNGLGHGVVNTRSSRIAEIMQRDPQTPANDRRAIARLYNDGDVAGTDPPLYEWFLDDLPDRLDPVDSLTALSGPGIAAMLDGLIVAPYDYPTNPTLDPDWLWGVGTDILTNSSFENGTNLITNPGFESGEVTPFWAGAVDGYSSTLVIETGTVDTGTYSAKCTPLLSEGGMSTTVRGLYPGKTYTVTARVNAGSGKSMQIGMGGPQTIGQGTADRILYIEASPYNAQYEAQKLFTGTGAWQTVSFTFVAGTDQTSGHLSIRDASVTPAVFYADVITVTGYGVGMSPWQPSDLDLVSVFEASTDVAADDGSYVAKITAADGSYLMQAVDNVQEGALYTASIKVRNTSGSAVWALELRDQIGTLLAQDSVATSTSWQLLEVSAVVPADLPGDRQQLQVWLVNYSGGTATVYADTATLYRGQPATTIGDILQQLFDDANSDHTAESSPWDRAGYSTFLDYSSFSTTLDSNGDAWDDPEIGLAVRRGKTMLEVMSIVGELGYDWELIPDPASDGDWLVNVYNPGGLGTDYTSSSHPALIVGQATVGGPITRRHVSGNWVLAEGRFGHLAVAESASQQASVGLTERYRQVMEATDPVSIQLAADDQLDANLDAGLGMTFRIRPSGSQSTPFVDFTRGDIVNCEDPGRVSRAARRVASVGVEYTAETGLSFVVAMSSQTLSGPVAIASATSRLLRKLQDIAEDNGTSAPVTVTGGQGAVPTVLVAAVNARDRTKAVADYVCDGVNDNVEIQAAITAVGNAGLGGGRVVLSEGEFNVSMSGGYGIVFNKSYGGVLQGMGMFATVIQNEDDWSADDPIVSLGDGVTVRDLAVIQNYYDATACGGILTEDYATIENCYVVVYGSGIYDYNTGPYTRVIGNVIDLADTGIDIGSDSCIIAGNMIQNATTGILVGGDHQTVEANWIDEIGEHGIRISGATNLICVNNHLLDVSRDTTNSYDGIFLEGDSDDNLIQGNKIVPAVSGNVARYGINLSAATCDDNVVVGNDLRPSASFGTGAYNDSGTGTINTYPAGAAGDNFV